MSGAIKHKGVTDYEESAKVTHGVDDEAGTDKVFRSKDPEPSDIQIEIEDDTPLEDRVPPRDPKAKPTEVTDEELNSYSEGVKKRIQQLTYDRHEERRARERAERERLAALDYAKRALEQNKAYEERLAQMGTTLSEKEAGQLDAELEKAKSDFAAAYEAGETQKLLEAQERIADIKARKAVMAARAAQAPRKPAQQPQQHRPAQQPQQAYPQQVDPKLNDWMRKNPWFHGAGHEVETAFAYGLHQKLVNNGMDPRTDEYYDAINKGVRDKFPELFGGEAEKSQARSSVPVAPANRGTAKAPRTVRLTESQVSIAKRLGVPLDVYARQLLKEKGNG